MSWALDIFFAWIPSRAPHTGEAEKTFTNSPVVAN